MNNKFEFKKSRIEEDKGDLYRDYARSSFFRDTIQNSLDAAMCTVCDKESLGHDKNHIPNTHVKIKISEESLDINKLHEFITDEYKERIIKSAEKNTDFEDTKKLQNIKNLLREKKSVPIIKIEDFGTMGLDGDINDEKSRLYNCSRFNK